MRLTPVIIVVLALISGSLALYNLDFGKSPKFQMLYYIGDGNEYYVRPQSMCDGGGWAEIEWNRTADTVGIHMNFHGLPKHPHLCYEFNPSTAYNTWPDCVSHGKWRLLIVHHTNKFPIKYYYNTTTGILLGSEYDYYGHTAAQILDDTTLVNGTGHVMLITEPIRIDEDLATDQVFTLRYSSLRNYYGSTGAVDSHALTNLSDPNSLINVYTRQDHLVKPLPGFGWDSVIADVNIGGSMTFLPTYLPDPVPADLKGRDNLMLGPGASFSLKPGTNGVYDTPACWRIRNNIPNPTCGDQQVRNAHFFVCPV